MGVDMQIHQKAELFKKYHEYNFPFDSSIRINWPEVESKSLVKSLHEKKHWND